MLTFEQSKDVKPLCKIIGGKYNNKVISIDPNTNEADYVTTFKKLEIGNISKLQMVPDTSSERSVFYCTGPSRETITPPLSLSLSHSHQLSLSLSKTLYLCCTIASPLAGTLHTRVCKPTL